MRISDLKRVSFQAKGMKKPDECIVYPLDSLYPNYVKFQGDRTIGSFDKTTRRGFVNYKGSNSKYNHHLSPSMGAEAYEFPQEFVDCCIAAQPGANDTITLA